jgi:hypothetical protein
VSFTIIAKLIGHDTCGMEVFGTVPRTMFSWLAEKPIAFKTSSQRLAYASARISADPNPFMMQRPRITG